MSDAHALICMRIIIGTILFLVMVGIFSTAPHAVAMMNWLRRTATPMAREARDGPA